MTWICEGNLQWSHSKAQYREMGHVRKVPSKRQAVVDDDTKLNLLLALEENPITPARQLARDSLGRLCRRPDTSSDLDIPIETIPSDGDAECIFCSGKLSEDRKISRMGHPVYFLMMADYCWMLKREWKSKGICWINSTAYFEDADFSCEVCELFRKRSLSFIILSDKR
ncbi:hypothetical protein NQ318_023638 [Aromia moschata]|uniref:Uncharacterized protein n=1 Tax=Aromia moschata TaxID=1265417 RepID=A0AAV8YP12_9CUCU|nr:hypothetical protein NQ318_023638 [Aromia moschata]